MTTPEPTATPAAGTHTTTLVSRIVIRADRRTVWDELLRTEGLNGAAFNARMDLPDGLTVGGRVRMRTGSGKNTMVVGEILELDPPHRFVQTFRFTNLDDPPCRIIYELREVEGGTEFTLTSEGVAAGSKSEKSMRSGGDFITRTLKEIVENGRPAFKTRLMYGAMKHMEFMLPKACRSTNWP
ncbi:MAG: SRPBCC domain-containing protein [Phycisphaerales bacterium]|nr:SRPBCC domain-containing protein [Phycisphaerales bacterium]